MLTPRSLRLTEREKLMGKYLDLDDVCAGHPMAKGEVDALRAERDALREKVETQRKGLKAVKDLINETAGVYGYHLNGDLSPWGEFLEGGCNEAYLMEFEEALEGGE
jgi:hypothetical protein